jgi:glyoxylase-like metal-dependent hydrolase (beta-lactamase superfamily II)
MVPHVQSFYDPTTSTFSYVAFDRDGGHAAIVDPVIEFDPASARTSTDGVEHVLAFLAERLLTADWILETHAHADHLTGAAYLKDKCGAKVAIGRGIVRVQERFRALFGLGESLPADGSQFDRLLDDEDVLECGELSIRVLATPGHTDDSLTYLIGDAAFIGDTLFAPDTGSARTDFPGGDAHKLYRSIQRLFALPEQTRLFLCHDYPLAEREVRAEISLSEQKAHNIHVKHDTSEETFVKMRTARDATLPVPRLILPYLQVNIRAGHLPPPDSNGIRYMRLPLNQIGGA